MIRPGQIALFRFPQSNMASGKIRPSLVLCKIPGRFETWMVCMISSQLHQYTDGFDERINQSDSDFEASGLKTTSLIRIGRLAVIDSNILLGTIGEIDPTRLQSIKVRIVKLIESS